MGGVFAPAPGRAMKPAYGFGGGAVKTPMFQCPVSAIPDVVWTLLEHWRSCRAMGCLPVAGGWVDQPMLVRLAFPIFEQEMRAWEASRSASPDASMLAAVAGLKGRR